MKTNTVLLTVFTFLSLNLFAQLREQYNGSNKNNHIDALSFSSPSTGYVAFDTYIGFTSDSGKTFTQRYISVNNTNTNGFNVSLYGGFTPASIKAFSADSVLVGGDVATEPTILFSHDGGLSWKVVYHKNYNPNAPVLNFGITDLEFPGNGSTGYAVHHENILKTTNRGQTWTTILDASNQQLRRLSFTSTLLGYATGANKTYKTIDGGSNWSLLTPPVNSNGVDYNNVFFITDNTGYISDHVNYQVFKTTDGGAHWTPTNDPNYFTARGSDMHFTNDSTGFISLEYGYNVIKTSDSGKTWELCKKNTDYQYLGYGFTSAFFLSNEIAWFGGNGEYIMITTDGASKTIPASRFRIDTSGVASTGLVHLFNHSKPNYQYQWFVNGSLVATSYDANYVHKVTDTIDHVKLVVSNGIDASSDSIAQYFNVPPPPPVTTITSFTPQTASTGTIVSISGTNFYGISSVTFGGVPANTFTVVSPTLIQATVGVGASGSIAVTSTYNSATIGGFQFTTRLTITSFSPTVAPAGSHVTIFGSNFSATPTGNVVYFGAVRAIVVSASTNQLTVVVPAGATYSTISVTVNGHTAYSSLPFDLSFDNGGKIEPWFYPSKIDSSNDIYSFNIDRADFDGDGKIDIVSGFYSSSNRNRFCIYRNTSHNGTFSLADKTYLDLSPPPAQQDFATAVVIDINGDGKPDVVGTDSYYLSYFLNTSSPGQLSFGPKVQMHAPYASQYLFGSVDFDGDGLTDLYGVGDGLIVFKNTTANGIVSLTKAYAAHTDKPDYKSVGGNLLAGDIDGDGKPDIVCMGFYDRWELSVFKNTSNAGVISFADPVLIPLANPYGMVELGDVDGDGKLDIAVTNDDPVISILRNTTSNGVISFAPEVQVRCNVANRVKLADINGDGKPDLVGTSTAPNGPFIISNLFLVENQSSPGSISFLPKVDLVPQGGSWDLVVADLDSNDHPDIVTMGLDLAIFINQAGVKSIRLCDGSSASFRSNVAGSSYQWQENTGTGFANISDNANFSGTNSSTLSINSISASWNNDLFRCVVDGSFSNTFKVIVDSVVKPSVVVSTSSATICPGSTATFTALPTNGGDAPQYQWKLNGADAGTGGDSFSIANPANQDQVSVIMTSNASCLSVDTVSSKAISITVNPVVVASVSVAASASTICAGGLVTFTATPVNGGSSPSYQWQVDGVSAGTNNNIFSTNSLTANPRVTVTMTSSLCAAPASSNSVTVTVTPAPPANAGPDQTICRKSTTSIGSAGSGFTYSWTSSPAGFTSSVPTPVVSPSTRTNYFLEVSNGQCSGRDTVLVSLYNTEVANLGADRTICVGTTMPASMGVNNIPGYTYSWSPATGLNSTNAASVIASPPVTTTYYFTLTSPEGCVSRDTITVFVTQTLPTPVVAPSGAVSFCGGGQLSSSVLSGNQWYKGGQLIQGAVDNSYFVTQTGVYTVRYSNGICTSDLSLPVSVTVNPKPATPTISLSGSNLISSAVSGNQWYKDGVVISGATAASYHPTTSGIYTVQCTLNNCSSDFSAGFNFVATSINSPVLDRHLQILPNPVTDILYVKYNGATGRFILQLLDLHGKTLFSKGFVSTVSIDMHSYSAGLYVVKITNEKTGEQVQKEIIKL